MNPFPQLFSRWSRSPQPSRATARSHTFVPRVEALESRDMFSTVLASGLDGLFGSTVGPDGNLYVTEQTVGRISRINPDTGQVTTFATGLPSVWPLRTPLRISAASVSICIRRPRPYPSWRRRRSRASAS